jgi:hypothetical protein
MLVRSKPWSRAAMATLAAGAVGVAALAGLPDALVWSGLTAGDCAEYCENSTRCGPLAERSAVQQPLNAWSNLGFLFVGLLALRRPISPLAMLFAVSCGVLAVGSFLFHATITREMQWLDMVGTYAAIVAVIARGVVAEYGVRPGIAIAVALVADLLFAVFKWSIPSTIALPLLIVVASIPVVRMTMRGRRSTRAALLPGSLMLLALLFRQLDVAGIWCLPESRLYQGHALWHLLTAASLGAMYFFFEDAASAEAA